MTPQAQCHSATTHRDCLSAAQSQLKDMRPGCQDSGTCLSRTFGQAGSGSSCEQLRVRATSPEEALRPLKPILCDDPSLLGQGGLVIPKP